MGSFVVSLKKIFIHRYIDEIHNRGTFIEYNMLYIDLDIQLIVPVSIEKSGGI